MSKNQGFTTIPNHADGSQNSLLESGNQVEILESGITTFIFWLFSIFLYIMNHVMHIPLFGKQESQESVQESWNQDKIPKIPETRQ